MALRRDKMQKAVEKDLGVEISKEDPTQIYELQERLGKVQCYDSRFA